MPATITYVKTVQRSENMTMLCFELSMPNRGSWNGGWSGEGRCYARIRKFGRSAAMKEKAAEILAAGSYYYGWSDGWGASVSVREVTGSEARKIERRSAGFCGYDWMIDSIIRHGDIRVKGVAA
jgi:hypothetical protein